MPSSEASQSCCMGTFARPPTSTDVYTPNLDATAAALREAGFRFDRRRRRFEKAGVPVQLVTVNELWLPPEKLVEIEGIAAPSLPDLVTMKLRVDRRACCGPRIWRT